MEVAAGPLGRFDARLEPHLYLDNRLPEEHRVRAAARTLSRHRGRARAGVPAADLGGPA